jgi:HD-like signal output (HDOD) protein
MIYPDPTILAELEPLNGLNSTQLDLLACTQQVHSVPQGSRLLELGDTRSFSLYLLKGKLSLRSTDNRITEIDEQSHQARSPIAQLIPRQYEVIALTSVDYLMLDNQILEGLLSDQRDAFTATEIHAEETQHSLDETENLLCTALLDDLQNDCLVLPSLPDVAVRIGQAMREETTNASKLARIIQTDPAITTKLIRVANSPFYAGVSKVDSCSAAIVRLGSTTTHKLVLTLALRELFNSSSPELKQRMRELWEHSVKVSAVCFVLAKITGQFNPEHALLAGLLHDIGIVAILNYAAHFPEIANDAEKLSRVIHDMRGKIGGQILKEWDFMEDLVIVAEEAENWLRDDNQEPDYADLVIIAQLHSFIGTPQMSGLPTLDQVPALKKMGIRELTPKMSIKILDKAEEKIARAESLLKA